MSFSFLAPFSHTVKRCCVTSSWWRETWKCQLTGWSWLPVAPISVPCSQVLIHALTWLFASHGSSVTLTLSVLAGDMSESKAHQVEIREVDGLTLRKLVDYIYTAEIEVTEDNVQVRVRTV